jgi:hypothetical protein
LLIQNRYEFIEVLKFGVFEVENARKNGNSNKKKREKSSAGN